MAKKPTIDIKHPGKLHKRLGIPDGEPIPTSLLRTKLAAAKRAKDVEFERELVFALNARKFKHAGREELAKSTPEKL